MPRTSRGWDEEVVGERLGRQGHVCKGGCNRSYVHANTLQCLHTLVFLRSVDQFKAAVAEAETKFGPTGMRTYSACSLHVTHVCVVRACVQQIVSSTMLVCSVAWLLHAALSQCVCCCLRRDAIGTHGTRLLCCCFEPHFGWNLSFLAVGTIN